MAPRTARGARPAQRIPVCGGEVLAVTVAEKKRLAVMLATMITVEAAF